RSVDLIHAHSLALGYEFLSVARRQRAPLLVTFHGLLPAGLPELPSARRAAVFREARCFLVNTAFALSELAKPGCPVEKIRILPQGTDLDKFPFKPLDWAPGTPVRLLTVARLHEQKGHRFALRALAQLRRRGFDVRYRIVGAGPERGRLEEEASEL